MEGNKAQQAPRTALRMDFQASYVEVASDGGRAALPTVRFDRIEILSAIAKQWNQSSRRTSQTPARVMIFANLEHVAGDTAGAVIHGIFGVTLLLGLPATCAYSNVLLVIQTKNGQTYFAKGKGTGCAGLYYPQVPQMTALAQGINEAMKQLRNIPATRLPTLVPRLTEIPYISKRMLQVGVADRVIWPVQSTRNFPVRWGEQQSK